MLATSYSYSAQSGYAEQTLALSELGFANNDATQAALAANEMKVVFGGWHATAGTEEQYSRILLTFKDSEGEVIGLPIELNQSGTPNYAWQRRETSAIIPAGTVSLVYRVELSKSRDTGYLALFDDAFVYL
ncbi:hypothetical protein, partial [Pseudoalteromonas sp. XI10]|uniref:hypothetical protein n=1 Tax=Pseudoalteromonas sp. XI10 TaxID=1766621 RepID=UPI00137B141E